MSCLNFRFLLLLTISAVAPSAAAQALQEYEYQPDRIYPVRTALA